MARKMISSKEYIREVLKDRKEKAILENKIVIREKEKEEEEQEKIDEYYQGVIARRSLPVKYNNFITSVKEEFLGECVYLVFNESLNIFDRKSKKQEYVKKALVKNFIQEQGVDVLLRRFRNKNALLSEFALIVDNAVKKVTESTDNYNINSWTVDTDIKDRFIDDLEKCNSKEAIITITDRVTDAETDFVSDNLDKKTKINDILEKKKDRLAAISEKPMKPEEKAGLEESVSTMYDRKIKAIRNRHISSIYQVVAESMIKNALSDKDLKEIYIKEGNIDIDTVLEDAGIIYTFLETLNTTEMVDNDYINKFVNNI